MKTLTIRNLPDSLHTALKERARRSRRSLNQQVIAELGQTEAFETDEEQANRVEREIRQVTELRSRATGFFTAEEIDSAKKEGRA